MTIEELTALMCASVRPVLEEELLPEHPQADLLDLPSVSVDP
jgi:hypothetical protein